MTRRKKGSGGPGDAPPRQDTGAPPSVPHSITRRAFVKRSSGIFVAAGFPIACTRNGVVSPGSTGGQGIQQAAPVTGSIEVIVSGIDSGASDGGTVKISAVAPTQDVQGVTPLTKTLPTSGDSGIIPNIPIGTYRATYTPPTNQALAQDQVNPQSTDVTASTLAKVNWTVVAADGTIRMTVTGLAPGATDGGSASVLRTDVSGQSPVPLAVAGDGTAPDLGVTAGTYSITYMPPSGYAVDAGVPNPQDVTVASGQVQQATFGVTQATKFLTPDLINNASFEDGDPNSGWGPLVNASGSGTPTDGSVGSIVRSTAQAIAGATSIKIHSVAHSGSPEDTVRCFAKLPTPQTHFWVRVYYYWVRQTDGQTKWIRHQINGFHAENGPFTYADAHPLQVTWRHSNSTPAGQSETGVFFTLGAWHWLEYEVWSTVTDQRVRFWGDGTLSTPTPNPATNMYLDGNWLVCPGDFTSHSVYYLGIMGTVNYTNADADLYLDRLAVSSLGRIGP